MSLNAVQAKRIENPSPDAVVGRRFVHVVPVFEGTMSETQFYTLVAIPLVGILLNGGLFIYLGGRVDRLIDKVGELDSRVAVLEKNR